MPKYYTYILLSLKSHIFYFGSTNNIGNRLKLHNSGLVRFTRPHIPWKLVWYGSFQTEKEARDFELYLKSGSGKAFASEPSERILPRLPTCAEVSSDRCGGWRRPRRFNKLRIPIG